VRELVEFSGETLLESILAQPQVVDLKDHPTMLHDVSSAMEVIAAPRAEASRGGGAMLSASVLRILGHLAQFFRDRPGQGFDMLGRRQLYDQFRALLEVHFLEQLSVARYAEMLSVNERTLHRACREVAGESPKKIAHRRMVLESQRLLLYSAMSVGEISYHLGFKDPSNFSRFFVEHVRESPIMFRRARLG